MSGLSLAAELHVDIQRAILDAEGLWEADHESELEQAAFDLATTIMDLLKQTAGHKKALPG